MKKWMIGALMSVMALSTFAQKGERLEKTPEEWAAMRAEKMKAYLELSDEQTKKVELAVLTKMTSSKEVRAKNAEDKENLKKEMRPIHEQFKSSIKEILTAEQQTMWQEMRKTHHKKGHFHHRKCFKTDEKTEVKPLEKE